MVVAALMGVPALAQSNTNAASREVVQALPSQDVERLNDALRRLARNSRNLSALTDAGKASLALGDLEAAMGFFGRAEDISPNNASVKMGMAAVFLRLDRPIEALRMFSEAEAAGASSNAVASERGLAYDLVGNNTEAQASYLVALQRGGGAEVSRRLAISHAIAGNKEDFEIILKPLVASRDFAAFRARAFGLAILGETGEANAIASAVMPRDLASSMAPYLAYMPRLTKAQQAAAANLGIFPKAAEIGRDDPRIAQYADGSSASGLASAQGAGARLAPQGEPLGRASTDPRRRRPDRTGSGNALASAAPTAPIAGSEGASAREPSAAFKAAVAASAADAPADVSADVSAGTSAELPALAAVPSETAAPASAALVNAAPAAAPSVATVSAPVVQAMPVTQQPVAETELSETQPAAALAAVTDPAPVPETVPELASSTPNATSIVGAATTELAALPAGNPAPIAEPSVSVLIPQPAETQSTALAEAAAETQAETQAETGALAATADTAQLAAASAAIEPPAAAPTPDNPALNTPAGQLTEVVSVAAPTGESGQQNLPVPSPQVETFDLARASEVVDAARPGQSDPVPEPSAQEAPAPSPPTSRQSVSSAFADFSSEGRTSVAPAAGAVDLSAITIAREGKPEPRKTESESENSDHPKRFWVQIASVSDEKMLKSEYRRIARKAGDLLDGLSGHASEWGETNRLLAGPVSSLKQAEELVADLKADGVDSFVHTSARGKKVNKIQ